MAGLILSVSLAAAPAQAQGLDQTVRLAVAERIVNVPLGYIAFRPPAGVPLLTRMDSLDFNFWMPDRRYPLTLDLNMIGNRPAEPGRDPKNVDAFVVKVRSIRAQPEDGHVSPIQQASHLRTYTGPYQMKPEPFGLVHLIPEHRPGGKGPERLTYFEHPEGTAPHIMFRCSPVPSSAPSPQCEGKVMYPDSGISFWIRFPRTALPQWKTIVDSAKDLFVSWM